MSRDAISELVELIHALHRGADAGEIVARVDRAIEAVEHEAEKVFAVPAATLEEAV